MEEERAAERYVAIMKEIRSLLEDSQRALGPNPSTEEMEAYNEICTIVGRFSKLQRLNLPSPDSFPIQFIQALPCL